MKNLNKLGLIIGSISALALALPACSDDPATDGGTGGNATGGAGGKAGSASTGGGGAGGKATGGGGAAMGGAGGKATGGTGGGGAGGGGGKAGAGGGGGTGGGGAASADCTKWCSGAMGVVMSCAANDRPAALDTEAKCLAECKDAPAASLTCWNTHLTNANAGDKAAHCKHAMGNPLNGVCAEL